MNFLRQSTAVDIAIGPFVDSTDGVTAETALTISQADVRLKKNGGAWAQVNESTSATHEENGWYEKSLNTTDTDTVGVLVVSVNESGALPVWREFQVLEEAVYDALFASAAPGYLQPTTAGRTLDVSAGGEAGLDWANIGSPTTAVNLSGTSVKTATDVETDTQDIQSRLPAALVSGRIDASVGAMADNVMTAAAAAADFSQEIRSEIDTNSTQLAAIKAKTDNLPADPADESNTQAGLTAIASYIDTEVSAIKTKTDQLTFTTAGQVDATTVTNSDKSGYSLSSDFRIKKNTALANFMFVMLDSVDHVTPKTGLTITAERSLDGAAFGACANAAAEISAGVYKINLAAADLNADVVTLKFTATGADPRLVTVVTQTE